ncbi:transposase [Microcoleus sp. Pol11C2]
MDRFHVMKAVNEDLDKLRRAIYSRLQVNRVQLR